MCSVNSLESAKLLQVRYLLREVEAFPVAGGKLLAILFASTSI